MGRLLLLLLLTSTSSHTDSLQSELNFLLASATLFLSHFMSLLSHLYRSEEQRKNHREQLLPPLVKKQKPPPTPSPKLTHIYIHTHTQDTHYTHTYKHAYTFSPAFHPVSCGFWIKSQEVWLGLSPALVEHSSNLRLFFCANIVTFCPKTFTESAEVAVVLRFIWRFMMFNKTYAPSLTWTSLTEPS